VEAKLGRILTWALAATAAVAVGGVAMAQQDGEAFSAAVAASGRLDIASLSVDEARFSVAGSGDLAARGRATCNGMVCG